MQKYYSVQYVQDASFQTLLFYSPFTRMSTMFLVHAMMSIVLYSSVQANSELVHGHADAMHQQSSCWNTLNATKYLGTEYYWCSCIFL